MFGLSPSKPARDSYISASPLGPGASKVYLSASASSPSGWATGRQADSRVRDMFNSTNTAIGRLAGSLEELTASSQQSLAAPSPNFYPSSPYSPDPRPKRRQRLAPAFASAAAAAANADEEHPGGLSVSEERTALREVGRLHVLLSEARESKRCVAAPATRMPAPSPSSYPRRCSRRDWDVWQGQGMSEGEI